MLKLPLSNVAYPETLLINNNLPYDQDFTLKLNRLIADLTLHKARHVVLLTRSTFVTQSLGQLQHNVYIATPDDLTLMGNNHLKRLALFDIVATEGIFRQFTIENDKVGLHQLYQTEMRRPLSYLNYFSALTTLPQVPFSQALSGSLIDELVADKVVLIDLDYQQTASHFFIPPNPAGNTASLGELQAVAAHTLIDDSAVRMTPALLTVILMLLIFAIYLFTLQLLSPKGIFVFFAGSILLTYGLCLLLLLNWYILIPVFEFITVQFLAMIYMLGMERLREEALILTISANLNARLSQKVLPPSFYQSENPWDNLHTLINQQLNLHRSIFLAKVPNDHRVTAIHALNCHIDDIEELRRDFERTPYSDAMASQKPIRLKKRYFTSVQEGEVEYIAPLIFGGEILGFWALTVMSTETWDVRSFESNMLHLSGEISELLHYRNRYMQETRKNKNLFRRFFTLKLARVEYEALDSSVTMLEKRFNSLQVVFDGMSTASALYNLFGQITHSNRKMDEIVKQLKMPIYALTAHDFLLKLTTLSSQQIKQNLAQVTIKNTEVSLRIQPKDLQADYVLRIRPITVANNNDQQAAPFLLSGLLFEFIDVSDAQRIIAMKKDLYGQYFYQMRNSLSTLNLLCFQIRKQLPPKKSEYLDLITETLAEMSQTDWLIEDQLELQRTLTPQVIPLNPLTELQTVLNDLTPELLKKRIKLNLKAPTVASLVMAAPQQLQMLLELICSILIEDSDSNASNLKITVVDSNKIQQRRLYINFKNEGYGLPEEHLAKILTSPGEADSGDELLHKLVSTANNADYWGVKLTVESILGSGYNINLSIPVFSIS